MEIEIDRAMVTQPRVRPWAWLAAAVALALLWTVLLDAGPVSAAMNQSGMFLHELFHDGRHLIGVPCH